MSPVDPEFVMRVAGWRCAVCGASVDIAQPCPWRCPNATATDRRHLLQIVVEHGRSGPAAGRRHSLIDHDGDLAWSAYAAANGMDAPARRRLVTDLDGAVRDVAGTGFVPTPFARSSLLSTALGFAADGGVWVKDETGGVAGSQKARHLVTILLHLLAAEQLGHLPSRPPLAIASCGNAALAAATLARAAGWPIDVYVPTWMSDGFGVILDRLGATIHRCPRRDGDPPGDPAMLRFRQAVADGAIPFTVQGPENALCLDGGRTIGWEICAQAEADTGPLDRAFVQVGGGAFASCLATGYREACRPTRLHGVQVAGCAPLSRAWDRLGDRGDLGAAWSEVMTVWDEPQSIADGILDDETYDWIGVVQEMREGGGSPVVVGEQDVIDAHSLSHRAGFDVSETGAAGLAGLLRLRADVADAERVVVVMSGVTRSSSG